MNRIFCIVSLLLLSGCGQTGPEAKLPALNAGEAAAGALAQYDANGDGSIGGPELDKSPSLKSALKLIDADGNGLLSREEIQLRIAALQASKLPLIPFNCEVLLDGRALAGAEVRLVPETFMGPEVKLAAATTLDTGWASPTIKGETELQGVHLGFFRVEISKKDNAGKETIPSRYNTETNLGLLVALDSPEMEHGLTFRLATK